MMTIFSSFFVLAASVSLAFGHLPTSVAVGQEFALPIQVSSAGQETLGTDVVLTYDPKILSATKINPGHVYPDYPENLQDIDNVHGRLAFSGTVGLKKPQAVEGLVGKVFFRAKKVGTTNIVFSWKPKSTKDSHVVPPVGGIDLLRGAPPAVSLSFRPASSGESLWFFLKRVFSFDYLRF